ncbi:MmcQ/YjbR family DNA-binding protein [Mycobacterium paraintracellulare]|uniref:MmcQ/YjbR family DNA-binding protein n=1 Tax=Mycobacterium paraintracellulare TaxID=1138383 RepID=A0ABM7K1H3_9MYCO|nr:MmcQ/YjbR family DNA-binding protein [Mycobacterium paraintracellulare]BBY67814.1 hypothetical protein MPRI_00010 [Mycobacterium paraintracellulare]
MATWDEVARIVGELALTSEPSPHDWRVGKKLLAWERPLRPSERGLAQRPGAAARDILGVRVSEGVKFALIDDEPQTYFTTPHFDGYPAVLVNLAEISVRDLQELITEAWLTQAPRKLVQEFLADSR